jgi:hypothetical protein
MITQRLGAEEGDTPVEQQPAAMQDFDPTYDRCGSVQPKEILIMSAERLFQQHRSKAAQVIRGRQRRMSASAPIPGM